MTTAPSVGTRLTAEHSAMLEYRRNTSKAADFCITNAGGIRATIDAGAITRGEVLTSFPFGNAVVEVPMKGSDLWKVFEGCVSKVNQFNNKPITSFFQVSKDCKVEYNPDLDAGKRLISLEIRGEPVDMEKTYNVVTIDFVAGGGDNILEPVENLVILDTMDEVLVNYIQEQSPVDIKIEGRIAVTDKTSANSTAGGSPTTTGTAASSSPTNGVSRLVGNGWAIMLVVFATMLGAIQ